ncbi:hydroxyproline dehydrogenase isoform X1 [Patagioenas fasciata]|uniref:hydroxyproline dehydrogenase isoform X1 n=1 Tax=Patagioenas fasciata TaxID=372321 RepID=UPI003A98D989
MGRPPAPGTPLNIGGRALRGLRYGELGRALLVLGLCALPPIVRHAEAILWVSRRVLGRHLWVRLLRATFYGQFVGGRTHRELEATAPRLRSMGLRPIVAVPCEGDVGQEPQGESWYEANQRAALEGVGLAAAMGPEPMMQLRVTALLSARLCEDLGRCPAGEGLTMERAAAMMGGEEAALPALTPNQNRHLGVALRRLEEVAKAAVGRGVRLLLDAELSALDPPLATVTWALARRHNPERPWVWGTIQAYRRGAPERLWGSAAALRGSRFGVKLVRGAYLESERRAGGGARIHPTADATHRSYGRCLELALGLVAGEGAELMVATHNEASVLQATQRMQALHLPRSGGGVFFAQLYGMCDHVSLALGEAGYDVYKSVPVGSEETALPYLVRRAQENGAILGGGRRDREVLIGELKRRLLGGGNGEK